MRLNLAKVALVITSFSIGAAASALPVSEVVKKVEQLQVEAADLNAQNCLVSLKSTTQFFANWMPEVADQSTLANHGPEILNAFFKARIALHSRLADLTVDCAAQMRVAFRNMRASEDIIGVMSYKDKQINSESIKFAEQAVPVLEPGKYRPYQLNQQVNGSSFEFKKGDIMITKGVSLISSTISSFPKDPTLFSHIVFVYQDDKTQKFGTIESYIGTGVNLYPIKEALLNENARILVLRPKDQRMAQDGHDYMLKRVKDAAAAKKHIAYDYAQDFTKNDRLSCEEIAYDAYSTASQGKVQIPWSPSEIFVKDKNFITSSGLRNGAMMLPADMEVDPRFDIVLDWTDYRIMRDSWRKDAVLRETIRWINEENYVMADTFKGGLGKMIWVTRNIPVLWPLMAKVAGIPKDFEKEVPGSGIAMMANIKTLGGYIMPKLAEADEAQFKQTGQWMSPAQLDQYVNKLRLEDKKKFDKWGLGKFHTFFHPSK
jgi:pterin-4a-carbinolamine dehydratase